MFGVFSASWPRGRYSLSNLKEQEVYTLKGKSTKAERALCISAKSRKRAAAHGQNNKMTKKPKTTVRTVLVQPQDAVTLTSHD